MAPKRAPYLGQIMLGAVMRCYLGKGTKQAYQVPSILAQVRLADARPAPPVNQGAAGRCFQPQMHIIHEAKNRRSHGRMNLP